MTQLRATLSISLDGFLAGPNPSEEHPLGEGGMQLHEWAFALAAWREPHGRDGGEVNASTAVMERMTSNIGAVVMGRRMFGGGPGPWGDEPWQGWWGEEPPFGVPVFVVTNHAREPLAKDGGTTFHFVTDGVESAYAQARDAAGDADVSLAGGADVTQQLLRAGLLDELTLSVVPVLLSGGTRLLDKLGGDVRLEQVDVVQAPGVTHLRYRRAG
ncbi:MAG TPA: dihydrofolate reductase family protein [Solirubrobacteraceae bacterium]|jgi:dihydrofolate reductase|nr:dihydrofolate reductase family protein [Solirubrobacteraceae bacterium]